MRLAFIPSVPYTVGVEMEVQLLDPATMDLAPVAPQLLAGLAPEYHGRVKSEFIRSMVELATPVCRDIAELERELAGLCRLLEEAAQSHDVLPYAASLHPFAGYRQRQVSPGPRYHEIMAELQLVGRRMMTQALHVHVGLPDSDTLLAVFNPIRAYLPLLLALTASSPFFEGEDTGMASYRTSLFKALPRSGIPEELPSWRHFETLVTILSQGTSLTSVKELWWDVRPHPEFGTIEIRICDLPSRFRDIVTVAALIQALVRWLAETPAVVPRYREVMLNNKWHASRYGLDGVFVGQEPSGHLPMRRAVARLLDELAGVAAELDSAAYLEGVGEILERNNAAWRQRQLLAEHGGDFAAMIKALRREFWQ